MTPAYAHIAARIFDVPLMVHPTKAEIIAGVMGPRMTGDVARPAQDNGEPDDDAPKVYQVADGIAVIPVTGTLVNRSGWLDAESGLQSYSSLREQMEEAVTDSEVHGIVLDVDSPGGEVAGCFDLCDFLREAATVKPIWATAGDSAYSAAYAIAASTQRVYVTRTGGVGSVGVIALHLDHSAADTQAGRNYTVFRAGEYKADLNSYEPLTAHATQSFQSELDRLYGIFVQHVATSRGLKPEDVAATEARCYYGPNGIEAGLADRIGTLDDAVAQMRVELAAQQNSTAWVRMESAHGTRPDGGAALPPFHPGVVHEDPGSESRGSAAPSPPSQEEDPMADTTTAPVAAAPETGSDQGKVVDLDSVRAGAEADALARFKKARGDVTEMCALAGMPELSGQFVDQVIDGDLTVDDVRKALVDAKASQEEASAITSAHDVAAATPQVDIGAVYAELNKYHRQAAAGR